jgi:hypothetical protein
VFLGAVTYLVRHRGQGREEVVQEAPAPAGDVASEP